jgi:hypothetical protein
MEARTLKPGEWLDDSRDPDIVDEFNAMCDALGVPKTNREGE